MYLFGKLFAFFLLPSHSPAHEKFPKGISSSCAGTSCGNLVSLLLSSLLNNTYEDLLKVKSGQDDIDVREELDVLCCDQLICTRNNMLPPATVEFKLKDNDPLIRNSSHASSDKQK